MQNADARKTCTNRLIKMSDFTEMGNTAETVSNCNKLMKKVVGIKGVFKYL